MPGIDRDGGGIDMFPDLTEAAVDAIGQAGSALDAQWRGKLGEIAGLDSQLGNGPMGVAVAGQYNPSVDQITAGMDQTRDAVTQSVDLGHRCVGIYVQADQQSAGGFGG
ncbi:hypothetical protein [Actinokineospora bangkokensis]|uniref:ESX-1 secretion-associated protein n=1 Tax=Actinokineospora bangkokensis TaxID=1193682 RepID=A0A1Q9LTC6_9PSEU|nr:hypothetical protein [Actinokineospora bangkokensis]OLR95292.1 hypothetical protein BJP25_07360 [Actinokineospora bangkokensis]